MFLVHGFDVCVDPNGFQWNPMGSYGFLWIPMVNRWIRMDSYGFLGIPIDSYDFPEIPMASDGFLWIAPPPPPPPPPPPTTVSSTSTTNSSSRRAVEPRANFFTPAPFLSAGQDRHKSVVHEQEKRLIL